MAPAYHGSTDDRQQDQHQSQGTEPAHPAAAQQVDEGEDPDRRYGGCGGRNGVVEDGEEDRGRETPVMAMARLPIQFAW